MEIYLCGIYLRTQEQEPNNQMERWLFVLFLCLLMELCVWLLIIPVRCCCGCGGGVVPVVVFSCCLLLFLCLPMELFIHLTSLPVPTHYHCKSFHIITQPPGHCFSYKLGPEDTSTFELQQTFSAHKTYVLKTLFSPQSKLLATTSADKSVKLWNVKKDGTLTLNKTLKVSCFFPEKSGKILCYQSS